MHQPVERVTPAGPATRASDSNDGAAYAGRPFGAAPSAFGNKAAVFGAALSVVPIVGMILSILGLARAQTLGGAGRTVATVGLVFSVAFTAGEAYGAYDVGGSTPTDPACVAAQGDLDAFQTRLSDDAAALSHAQATGDATAASAADSTLVTDLGAIRALLQRGVSQSTHADVRSGLQAFDADLGLLISSVRQVEDGDQAALGQVQSSVGRLHVDGQSVDALCDGRQNRE